MDSHDQVAACKPLGCCCGTSQRFPFGLQPGAIIPDSLRSSAVVRGRSRSNMVGRGHPQNGGVDYILTILHFHGCMEHGQTRSDMVARGGLAALQVLPHDVCLHGPPGPCSARWGLVAQHCRPRDRRGHEAAQGFAKPRQWQTVVRWPAFVGRQQLPTYSGIKFLLGGCPNELSFSS